MKTLLRLAALSLASALASSALAADFKENLGLQIYSLRDTVKTSPTAALDLAKSYGVKEVELYTGAWGKSTPSEYVAELKSRGLVPISGHFGYNLFEKDVNAVIKDAKTLGLKYVVVPYPKLDKDKLFSEEIARETAAKFNEWGAACKKEGLTFGFHPHGLEFRPTANGGTIFDILMKETKPDLVTFQMDVYWAYYAGQDPVKLFAQYPGRWSMIHIKDMLKGLATGVHTGGTPPTAKVPVGTGQIDYVRVIKAAQKAGVKHYFLEDETPTPLQSIPDSFKYLREQKI